MSTEQAKAVRHRTKRPVSRGAEKWLGKKIPCLDKGFVYLVDYMGNDEAIEEAARVSYGQGTRSVSATEGLIRYLRRHDHTTPFEMVEVKLHAKVPIFTARQWMRHRTASINELSARYSIVPDVFYIPADADIALQSETNRQGRGETASPEAQEAMKQSITMLAHEAYDKYERLIEEHGLAREVSRTILPQGYYTEFYWKLNLHNLMHFLKLRMDEHAQKEIRVYAEAIEGIFESAFPIAHRAFVDYELESVKLSRLELLVARRLAKVSDIFLLTLAEAFVEAGLTNQRERLECVAHLRLLGVEVEPFSRTYFEDFYLPKFNLSTEEAREREWEGLNPD